VLSRRNLSYPSHRSTPNSRWLTLLQTLCRRQKPQPLWNQANPNSLRKTHGCGVPRFPLHPRTAHYPLPTIHSPLTTFRMNTCKSVSKQRTLTIFRMNTYAKRGEGGTPLAGPEEAEAAFDLSEVGVASGRASALKKTKRLAPYAAPDARVPLLAVTSASDRRTARRSYHPGRTTPLARVGPRADFRPEGLLRWGLPSDSPEHPGPW